MAGDPLRPMMWEFFHYRAKHQWRNLKDLIQTLRTTPIAKWPRAFRVLSKMNYRDDARRMRAANIGAFVQLGFRRTIAIQFIHALEDPEAMEKLTPSQQRLLREFKVGLAGMVASGGLVATRQARYERWYRAVMRLRLRRLQEERKKMTHIKTAITKRAITGPYRKGRPAH